MDPAKSGSMFYYNMDGMGEADHQKADDKATPLTYQEKNYRTPDRRATYTGPRDNSANWRANPALSGGLGPVYTAPGYQEPPDRRPRLDGMENHYAYARAASRSPSPMAADASERDTGENHADNHIYYVF